MKTLLRAGLVLTIIMSSLTGYSQSGNELNPGYYVVVGAYHHTRENIAQNYVDILTRQGYNASYGFNASRKLYYVYVHFADNLKTSLNEMYGKRRIEKFEDAWVRVVPGDIVILQKPKQENQAKDVPPPALPPPAQEPARQADVMVASTDSIVITDNEEIKQYKQMNLGNTEVFLSLYNKRNNRIVDGDIEVEDTEREKILTKVKGNEYLMLPDPKSNSGQLTLITEVFGYRKVEQEINYPVPLADTVKPHIDLMGTTVVINFDLVRYKAGDRAVMHNVFFYNDAAIMGPQSSAELNSLLGLMQEVPTYRITIHGHTNGNYKGRIITLGPDKNFFSLTGAQNTVGSAKDLSRLRAETIREYLITNGIAGDRIEVKAWGGKKPLFDKNSVNAKKNVRVEIEFLQE